MSSTMAQDTAQQTSYHIPRLSDMPAAHNRPLSVRCETPLAAALTMMRINDFSQLPVMHSDRMVDGYISWRTIGEAYASGKSCTHVKDCMSADVITLDESMLLLDAVSTLV
jgi:predicted transcriptional regulator